MGVIFQDYTEFLTNVASANTTTLHWRWTMKQPTSKQRILDTLFQQRNKLVEPIRERREEIKQLISDSIDNSSDMHELKVLHQEILDYLLSKNCFPDPNYAPHSYKNVSDTFAYGFSSACSRLKDAVYKSYAVPYQDELKSLDIQQSAIFQLYDNITATVRALSPALAKKYVIELQLNIPLDAFSDPVIPTVLPDNPILQAVRAQLQLQIGGTTHE